jgi:hypothetical protein
MANRQGWKIVKRYIEENMKPVEERLFNADLDKEEFKACQRERQAYQKILDFVNRRINIIKK